MPSRGAWAGHELPEDHFRDLVVRSVENVLIRRVFLCRLHAEATLPRVRRPHRIDERRQTPFKIPRRSIRHREALH